MRLAYCVLAGLLVFTASAANSQERSQKYLESGIVQHHGTSATVIAHGPSPLRQAISAVSEEYGWIVDLEEPPFQSSFDLVDAATPEWRASHPDRRGLMVPAGGLFQADYPEGPNTSNSTAEEEAILGQIVATYNQSGNPGRFVVRKESEGRFAVVGQYAKNYSGGDQFYPPILDTIVSLPTASRGYSATIDLILDSVASKTGTRIHYGRFGDPDLGVRVTVGGQNVPARTLLLEVLANDTTPAMWRCVFLPDMRMYILTIFDVQRATTDIFGRRVLVSLRRR